MERLSCADDPSNLVHVNLPRRIGNLHPLDMPVGDRGENFGMFVDSA